MTIVYEDDVLTPTPSQQRQDLNELVKQGSPSIMVDGVVRKSSGREEIGEEEGTSRAPTSPQSHAAREGGQLGAAHHQESRDRILPGSVKFPQPFKPSAGVLLSDSILMQLPNILTCIRVLLIPLLVVAIGQGAIHLALFLFITAAVTDYVDGFLARRFGAVSDFGKLLDPLADKVLVMAALVMLVSLRGTLYGDPWVKGWLVVLVLAREFWVTGLRGVAASRGVVVAAGSGGKWKSALQMGAIVLLFLHETPFPYPLMGYQVPCQQVGESVLLMSIVLSYWSAVEYTTDVFRLARRE